MKTLGLIGGLSWFSTTVYYKIINQLVGEQLGNHHSAKLLLYSVDVEEFSSLIGKEEWAQVNNMFSQIALMLENAGADCIAICSNTPHLVADAVRQKIKIPLLHIAEETAKEIVRQRIKTVGLLGTKFTMENSFFRDKLSQAGIETVIPGDADREYIHDIIFDELTKGIFREETKNNFLGIMDKLKTQGAEGIIFGCTEIGLLINPGDYRMPVFDTTFIHSKSLVDFALSEAMVQTYS